MLSQYPVGVEDDAPGDVIHGSLSQNNNPVPNNDAPITVTDLASLAYNGGASTGRSEHRLEAKESGSWGAPARSKKKDNDESAPVKAEQAPTPTDAHDHGQ